MSAPIDCSECDGQSMADLPTEDLERFEQHLESCAVCQERFDRPEEELAPLMQLARQGALTQEGIRNYLVKR